MAVVQHMHTGDLGMEVQQQKFREKNPSLEGYSSIRQAPQTIFGENHSGTYFMWTGTLYIFWDEVGRCFVLAQLGLLYLHEVYRCCL